MFCRNACADPEFARLFGRRRFDEALVFFVSDLHMRVPLALLLVTTAPQELARRTQAVEFIEKTQLLGSPSFHIAGRTASVATASAFSASVSVA